MENVYIVDSKLYAYSEIQRKAPISNIFNTLARDLMRMTKRGKVYVVFDVGHSSYREAEQSYYKGDRRKNYKKKSQAERDAHVKFNEDYLHLVDLFRLLDVTVVAVQGVEADDLASIIALEHSDKRVTLLSADRDWLHSVVDTHNVVMYSGRERKYFNNSDVVEKYGTTTRRQFTVLKAIAGDDGDTLKAFRNIGPVKSTALFNTLYEDGGNPTDTEIIETIEAYMTDNNSCRIHEYHTEDGRDTVRQAFLSNMLVGATFEDTTKMTYEQALEYGACMAFERKQGTIEEFVDLSIKLLGYPIILTDTPRKVFKI